jgi:hypothetical protein
MRTIKTIALPVAAALCFSFTAFAQNTVQNTVQAAPAAQTQPAAKAKTIKFTVVNTTKGPVALRSGEEEMTLAAGQSRVVKATAGTRIVTTADSSVGQSGTVVAEVSDVMQGATVNVR